jgi:hypothetical protein
VYDCALAFPHCFISAAIHGIKQHIITDLPSDVILSAAKDLSLAMSSQWGPEILSRRSG